MELLPDGKVLLSYEEAVSLLPPRKIIHICTNPWEDVLVRSATFRETVVKYLKTAKIVELSGPEARKAGFGLAFHLSYFPFFVETTPSKVRKMWGNVKGEK